MTHGVMLFLSSPRLKSEAIKRLCALFFGQAEGPIITSEGLGVGAARGLK